MARSRAYYSSDLATFLDEENTRILGTLSRAASDDGPIEPAQLLSWEQQIRCLTSALRSHPASTGGVFFEYAVPRLGRRIDVVLVLGGVVFVIEFKVGAKQYTAAALDQVWDYALDLKNFHETSHDKVLCPVLVATDAPARPIRTATSVRDDGVLVPICCNSAQLDAVLDHVLQSRPQSLVVARDWDAGRYAPTPSIIEAALALYSGHGVAEISRFGAEERNLRETSSAVDALIEQCRESRQKAICFVTGVPGAGKTLVGLNVAATHAQQGDTHSVFLSGNGPLVAVLREALTRDQVRRTRARGEKLTKSAALTTVKSFIQNVHHFRDEYLRDQRPPVDHVAVFDEAQRAWNLTQTAAFMQRKRGQAGFDMSEPEYLISCMDRHPDWAVIVCLVGGGQEINTGEAGIRGWLEALSRRFPHWKVHLPAELRDSEYQVADFLRQAPPTFSVVNDERLHLAVSMRSFRAQHVSTLVKQVLDLERQEAVRTLVRVLPSYPIVLTRDVNLGKEWVRSQARGNERYGLMVSSQAERLRPHAIHVRAPMDPVHWFLDGKEDVRSSYYLEDVATEFHVQGLELDWGCVVWDGDFRFAGSAWTHHAFVGSKWQNINSPERRTFQKNAYRVLLTRARQGVAIVVPTGTASDATRDPKFYDSTFEYLRQIGIPVLR
ncbi:DUF2075 domain-containing protein [Ramlibacter algicola]|uniref:DUF2075 domain-containing protein n=1 Tax=Ramlibacter algicola TaxID=2795217 RepID=UPI00308406EF